MTCLFFYLISDTISNKTLSQIFKKVFLKLKTYLKLFSLKVSRGSSEGLLYLLVEKVQWKEKEQGEY